MEKTEISPFEYVDYKKFLKAILAAKGATKTKLMTLAKSASIEPTYLSRILRGKGNLSADQLFLLLTNLNLRHSKIDYVLLLLELSRCNVEKRQKLLRARIEAIRREQNKLESSKSEIITSVSNEMEEYYENILPAIVHMASTIPSLIDDSDTLAQKLSISKFQLMNVLEKLKKLGFIAFKDGKTIATQKNVHLDKHSKIFRNYISMTRNYASHKQMLSSDAQDVFYVLTFAANEDTRASIRERFKKFYSEVFDEIQDAKEKEVYQMSFDLFRI